MEGGVGRRRWSLEGGKLLPAKRRRVDQVQRIEEREAGALRAAQTIPSVADAVAELVGNALDAAAMQVEVHVDVVGCALKVMDDGKGIRKSDLALLGKLNASSKWTGALEAQLFSRGETPLTHGFKGEALYAMSHIGVLVLETRPKGAMDAPTFRKVVREGRVLEEGVLSTTPRQYPGTTVDLRDIFFKMPVRRKVFVKSSSQTLGSIKTCLERFALASPKVQFLLVDAWSKKLIWHHQGCHSTRQAFSQIFGQRIGSRLCDRSLSGDGIDIAALVSPPLETAMQSSSCMQFIFINGRAATSLARVERFINKLYRDFIDKELAMAHSKRPKQPLFPAFVLSIRCDTALYDILWEPTKSLVRFKDWQPLLDLIQRMLLEMFHANRSGPAAILEEIDSANEQVESNGHVLATPPPPAANDGSFEDEGPSKASTGDAFSSIFFETCSPETNHKRLFTEREEDEEAKNLAKDAEEAKDASNCCSESSKDCWSAHKLKHGKPDVAHENYRAYQKRMRHSQGVALTNDTLKKAIVIAQVGAKFILLKAGTQLLCIDQHAADERVRLESFEKDLEAKQGSAILSIHHTCFSNAKGVTTGIPCSLTHRQQITFAQAKLDLESWGFKAQSPDAQNPGTVFLESVPKVFGVALSTEDFIATLEFAKNLPSILSHMVPPPIRNAVISRACRGAIKFGDVLSNEQCRSLVGDLSKCDFPFQCAHGRPTCCPLANIVQLPGGLKVEAADVTTCRDSRYFDSAAAYL